MSAITTKPLTMTQMNYIIESLESKKNWNYLAITLLLMKATRVGDLLNTITIEDVYTVNGEVRSDLQYYEGKTNKHRIIPIKGEKLINALTEVYKTISRRKRTDNLFYSRKSTGQFVNSTISNFAVNQNLQKFTGDLGIEAVSTHAIRKTACRHLFDIGTPIEVISNLLNHSDCRVTRTYLQINYEDVVKALSNLEI